MSYYLILKKVQSAVAASGGTMFYDKNIRFWTVLMPEQTEYLTKTNLMHLGVHGTLKLLEIENGA